MADFKDIAERLAGIVGHEHIKTDPEAVNDYVVDKMEPKAVLFPKNTQQVSQVVEIANSENLSIVVRGSGSKMAMGNPPKRLDLVVCTSRMNKMIDVDTANLTITVEAGVKFRDIQARLATEEDRCYLPLEDLSTEADEEICSDRSHSGSFLPIDPSYADVATIGGVIATNSSGPRRLLYNLPRDVILGVKLVTPTGAIAGAGGKTVKNVSGYDTSKLVVGSMGSLGILCEMTFKLLPLPEEMETMLISFDSFGDASELADSIFNSRLIPAAIEVMNGTTYTRLKVGDAPGFEPGQYVVAVGIEAFHEAVKRMVTEISKMAGTLGARSQASFEGHAHQRFWLAVSDLDPTLAGNFPGLVQAKLNYPILEWRAIFEFADRILSENKIEHTILAHAGSGVCLISLLLDQSDRASMDQVVEVMGQLLDRSCETSGNLVITRVPTDIKRNLKIWGEQGPDFIIMKRLKEELDPLGIMSPGRFVGGL